MSFCQFFRPILSAPKTPRLALRFASTMTSQSSILNTALNSMPHGRSPLMMPEPVYLGIDVGGTNVKMGLVDGEGRILAQTSTPTPPLGTPQRVLKFAIEYAERQLVGELAGESGEEWALGGVGLAVPGVLDTEAMMLREVVNLPGWVNQPLLELLGDACGAPATVVNDANAAAYAEHCRRGLGKRSLALVTLGTGIGCGVVVGGHPHGGDHGCAGELGHIAIRFGEDALPCTCGSRGHLESYAGAAGVIARLRRALETVPVESSSPKLRHDSVTPLDVAEAAAGGDAICQSVIDETAAFVGQAIGLLGQTIDPDVVLLGGAMTFGGENSMTGHRFLEHVRVAVRETTLVQVGERLTVDFATLGNDAGILGSAMLAQQVGGNHPVP